MQNAECTMQNASARGMRAGWRCTALLFACGILNCAFAADALAQWPARLPAGVPLAADGKPNLDAPAPRTPDGKIDLSGVWETAPPRRPGAAGTAEVPGGQAGALPPASAPRAGRAGGGRGNVDPL